VASSIHRLKKVGDEHLLRIGGGHRETSNARAPGIAIGERNRSRSVQPLQRGWRRRKASTREYGTARISTSGTKRARSIFQKGVCGKCSRQKTCQRAMVRRSAPKRVESSRIRRGVGPCRMALITMMMALKYTFGPRKRTDGGVVLFRQPSRSQQKLSLRRCGSGSWRGVPRGFRG
jgi:hypothetical protein